ncbi:FKBP-type peptidyl-prolyl cis-trans isomerase [Buchananella hordeovulneris]|uniref:FKBP-type peptidyl-prolyl cis-trans isomerase n=1 Tax=Buchananella hordeovulneris TaxID=52770 RepID=UPI0009FC7CA8|nr:FKBP-type peptidyl-prolyl cis-trans isomerase [Buchananella hordeovulneris]
MERPLRRSYLAVLAASTLALTACSTAGGQAGQSTSPSAVASASASTSAAQEQRTCATAEGVFDLKTGQDAKPSLEKEIAGGAAKVQGGRGQCPVITFAGAAPKELKVDVLLEGDGPVVEKGDWLTADYYGKTWDGVVFDTSFDRPEPLRFELVSEEGRGVIKGWTEGLAGRKLGDRVALTIPASLGYGEAGAGDKIKPNETLVFIVDLVAAEKPAELLTASKGGQLLEPPADLPFKMEGELGSEPEIVVNKDAAAPTEVALRLLSSGTGQELKADDVITLAIKQVAVPDGKVLSNTWQDKDFSRNQVPIANQPLFKELVGQQVGARFAMLLPDDGAVGPSVAVVEVVSVAGPVSRD